MNVLVTAGNMRAYIDKVRCLTNIFTGRTGAAIALEAAQRGHHVSLLTSHPEAAAELSTNSNHTKERWRLWRYDTLDDLYRLMQEQLESRAYEAVIHCAAVSDYLSAGIFAPAPGTSLGANDTWLGQPPALVNRSAGKVKSDEPELWLRLVRAPKLIDMVRSPWGFRGTLVKFKLEVGVGDDRLLEIAEKSRVHSQADFMVANTLEGASAWAYLGPLAGRYEKISRRELPARLMEAVESKLGCQT